MVQALSLVANNYWLPSENRCTDFMYRRISKMLNRKLRKLFDKSNENECEGIKAEIQKVVPIEAFEGFHVTSKQNSR